MDNARRFRISLARLWFADLTLGAIGAFLIILVITADFDFGESIWWAGVGALAGILLVALPNAVMLSLLALIWIQTRHRIAVQPFRWASAALSAAVVAGIGQALLGFRPGRELLWLTGIAGVAALATFVCMPWILSPVTEAEGDGGA